MDKKNVQNRKVKMLLTEKKFCLDSKKLSSQIKPEKIFLKSIFFIFFAEKYLGTFSVDKIRTMLKSSVPKSSSKYICECCDYNTSRKSQYDRHLNTDKHQMKQTSTICQQISTEKSSPLFECPCGKIYKERTGLWKHKKVCKGVLDEKEEIVSKTSITDDTVIKLLIEQFKELKEVNNGLVEIIKNGTHNTTNTNSHNKTFNLQLFLNETCKDAMNIMDFVDSIKLQLSDLIKMGDVGYVEGISNIITTNLKALDVTQRPIHCADKKREVIYVKDEDKWEKEDEDKKKLRKLIKKVSDKNSLMLFKFKEEHPDCVDSHSRFSDQYNKLIIEAFGGRGDNDVEKEDKIIRNISKHVTIDK
jgi:hypothetical protein